MVLFACTLTWATTANITVKGYTPRMVVEGLADRVSSGLANVGVHQKIFLWGNAGDTTITAWNWTMAIRPPGSTATLSGTAIVNPTFIADVKGSYLITLTVTGPGGASPADSVWIHAGYWIGNGAVDAIPPVLRQCVLCHDDKVVTWDSTGHAHMLENMLINGAGSETYELSWYNLPHRGIRHFGG